MKWCTSIHRKYDLSNVKFFQKNGLFHNEMILRPLFRFKDTKNTGLLIFNSLKQKELISNFVANRNWKKLTDSRKRAKILGDNRKSHHPIETLFQRHSIPMLVSRSVKTRKFKLLCFRNETCYRNENLYKDLLFVHLQPSVNKNS